MTPCASTAPCPRTNAAIRDAAHDFLPGGSSPPHPDGEPHRKIRPRDHETKFGEMGLPRPPRRLRLRRRQLRQLRPHLPRSRARSIPATARPLRSSSWSCTRSMRSDQKGPAPEIPAQTAQRRIRRLFRPDRTRRRLRSRLPCAPAPKKVDGGLSAERLENWITNSPIADVLVVWAKDDAGDIRGYILERGNARA